MTQLKFVTAIVTVCLCCVIGRAADEAVLPVVNYPTNSTYKMVVSWFGAADPITTPLSQLHAELQLSVTRVDAQPDAYILIKTSHVSASVFLQGKAAPPEELEQYTKYLKSITFRILLSNKGAPDRAKAIADCKDEYQRAIVDLIAPPLPVEPTAPQGIFKRLPVPKERSGENLEVSTGLEPDQGVFVGQFPRSSAMPQAPGSGDGAVAKYELHRTNQVETVTQCIYFGLQEKQCLFSQICRWTKVSTKDASIEMLKRYSLQIME